jgi:GH24 family phage-related lysozyme (muramidase)
MPNLQQNRVGDTDSSLIECDLRDVEIMGVVQDIMNSVEFSSKPSISYSGNMVIGFGRKLNRNPMTREEGLILLQNDLETLSRLACRLPYYAELTPAQRGAVLEIIYSMGLQEYKKLRKVERALEDKNYNLAAKEFLNSTWAHKNNKYALKLSKKIKKT